MLDEASSSVGALNDLPCISVGVAGAAEFGLKIFSVVWNGQSGMVLDVLGEEMWGVLYVVGEVSLQPTGTLFSHGFNKEILVGGGARGVLVVER